MLDKAVHKRSDTGGSRENSAPELEGQIRRDDKRPVLVPATDDIVEQVGSATVTGQVAKFINDQKFRREIPVPQSTFKQRQRIATDKVCDDRRQ